MRFKQWNAEIFPIWSEKMEIHQVNAWRYHRLDNIQVNGCTACNWKTHNHVTRFSNRTQICIEIVATNPKIITSTCICSRQYLHIELMVYAIASCGKPIKTCLLTRNMVSGFGAKLNTRSAVTLIVPGIDFNMCLPRSIILLINPRSDVDSIDSDARKLSRSNDRASSSNPCTATALSNTTNMAEITNNLHFILRCTNENGCTQPNKDYDKLKW